MIVFDQSLCLSILFSALIASTNPIVNDIKYLPHPPLFTSDKKHCVFLQLHNMKYVCFRCVDDKDLAGFGSRSFDMHETGRESEDPADLIR